MSDQSYNLGCNLPRSRQSSQVCGSIERMETRINQARGVSDVVKPRGAYNLIGSAWCETARQTRSSLRHRHCVRPPTGQRFCEQVRSELSRLLDTHICMHVIYPICPLRTLALTHADSAIRLTFQ
jgi:hypothetical protein